MLQINPFLDCTVYSGIVVHIGRNSQLEIVYEVATIFFALNIGYAFVNVDKLLSSKVIKTAGLVTYPALNKSNEPIPTCPDLE